MVKSPASSHACSQTSHYSDCGGCMVAQPLVITVSGTATHSVTPDRAKVTLVAEGTGLSIAQAIKAHAAEVQKVVQAVIACGAQEENIHGAAPRIVEED